MARWTFQPVLAADSRQPRFLRLAHGIAADIRAGRLRPGDRLPGSRSLARTLGWHRNTVVAAFDELAAQGWVESRPAGGTFVSSEIPTGLGLACVAGTAVRPPGAASSPGARASGPPMTFALPPAGIPSPWGDPWRSPVPAPPGMLVLASGMPDLRLVPAEAIARAYRRAMRVWGRTVLGYGDPRGHERLRTALAAMLASLRGLAVGPEDLIVTRGSQQALDLVARALLAPGDAVAVEALGYRPAWDALRLSGARLVPVPVDGHGMHVETLAALATRERIRAVYTTPHHQYPTTVTLAAGRRLALLDLARHHGLALIEDDYDYEFHYGGRPVLPLASRDEAGSVVYLGTLSKILAPGLRLGFVAGPRTLLERIAAVRTLNDRQGDQAQEVAVAELLVDGDIQRHALRMARIYRQRRDVLADELGRTFGAALTFTIPAGGMAIWATADPAIDVEAWARRAPEHGVQFSPGTRFAFAEPAPPNARLGFAPLDEAEIREAVRRMAAALAGGRPLHAETTVQRRPPGY